MITGIAGEQVLSEETPAPFGSDSSGIFSALAENSHDLVAVVQNDIVIYMNQKGAGLLGYPSAASLKNLHFTSLFHPAYNNFTAEKLAGVSDGQPWQSVVKMRSNDGSFPDAELKSTAFINNGVTAYLITGKLITEEEHFEAIKREQKLRFDILDAFREVVAFYSPDHHIIWLNKAGKRELGIKDDTYIGKLCHSVWFDTEGPCPTCPIVSRKLVTTERMLNLSGDRIWLVRHTPLFTGEGKLEGFIEFRADITQITELEKEILNEREKYRMLAENAPFGLLLTRNTEPVYINRILRFWLGVKSKEELADKDIVSLFHPEDKKQAEALIRMIRDNRIPAPVAERLRIVTRDGRLHYFRLELKNSKINGEEYVQTVVMDITSVVMNEKKQKQVAADALYISQKNRILAEIEGDLSRTISTKGLTRFSPEFDRIFETINSYKQLDKDWNMFIANFEEVHPGFFRRLGNSHPSLSVNDIRHCACIKMNLGTKEIARFFNVKAPSVQISRVRLKKKMGLPENADLRRYILNF